MTCGPEKLAIAQIATSAQLPFEMWLIGPTRFLWHPCRRRFFDTFKSSIRRQLPRSIYPSSDELALVAVARPSSPTRVQYTAQVDDDQDDKRLAAIGSWHANR